MESSCLRSMSVAVPATMWPAIPSRCKQGRTSAQTPTMVGQTCRFAQISPPASAAMLAEAWGYARKNIAPLVLVEIWAARPLTFHFSATRQRPPYLGVKLRPGNKNGACFWPAPLSPAPPERFLHVVIQEEFVRMRAQPDGVVFLALAANPHLDEVFGEDVAL